MNDDYKISKDGNILLHCKNKNIEIATIPKKVIKIDSMAFYDCKLLKQVNFHNNIQEIGVSAFGSCISIPNIKFPNSVKHIGAFALENCTSLKYVTMPDNPLSFGGGIFEDCFAVEKIKYKNIEYNIKIFGDKLIKINSETKFDEEKYNLFQGQELTFETNGVLKFGPEIFIAQNNDIFSISNKNIQTAINNCKQIVLISKGR